MGNVLQACSKSGNLVIEKLFLTTTCWFHSLVLTLILHKSHTELHCGCVSLVSRHSQPHFGQPLSPHPLLLCTAPLIHNGMSHALKRPLSWVHFLFDNVYILRSFCFFFSSSPSSFANPLGLWSWLSEFCLGTIVKSPPGKTHQRVFFSMGLCTTVVCVEAVRRAPALIRHK